jgi:hypothetical protein
MNTKKQGYVLISDYDDGKQKGYLVQVRGANGKITHSSVERLDRSKNVLINIQSAAATFGGTLKKTRVFDATAGRVFVNNGIAQKRHIPRTGR